MKVKNLLRWLKPYIPLFLLISFLAMFLPITYSFVPQFIRYVFNLLGHADETKNTLPNAILEFFDSYIGLKCIIVVSGTLAIYQGLRGTLMFTNGYLKGKLSESVAFDIRKKLYHKIQNIPASYHNTSDTGDLIQRCTSDIDTIRAFISNQLPNIIHIFTTIISGAIQMASININIIVIKCWLVIIYSLLTCTSIFLSRYLLVKKSNMTRFYMYFH